MRRKTELLNLYQRNKAMPTVIEGIKFYTIPETAEALRVTPQTIRAWIKQGKIKSQRIGRPILITEDNIREFLKPSTE
jgi:excisionase family DNA binding protein